MTLVKRPFADLEWPNWLAGRSMLDLPESWMDTWMEAGIRVEEFEEKGQFVVRAELPGVNPDEDIEITQQDSSLRIMVRRQKETVHEGKHHYRSEFQYGSFVRTISLPAGASERDVKASYKDGILEVRIPMNGDQAKTKKIAIQKS